MERKVDTHRKPKGLSFFKVLVGDYTTGLLIPKLFVKKFRSIVPDKAVLRVFPDKTWTVDIVEEDGKDLYFKNGWRTFVEDNGLQYGEFVIFKYEGNSTFKVKMYGFSACDKAIEMGTYHYYNVDADKGNHQERKPTAEDRHKLKQAENSDSNCDTNQSEALKGEEVSKRDDKEAEEQRKEDSKRDHEAEEKRKEVPNKRAEDLKVSGGVINRDDNKEAEEKAKEVSNKAEALKGTGVRRRVDQEAEEEENEIIEIELDSDREIGGYRSRQTQKKRRTIPNVVKEGSKQLELKNPAFQAVLTHTYIEKGFLNVPIDFFKEHMENKEQNLELHTSKRKWIVKLVPFSIGSSTYARLSQGWLDFVRDNKLRFGQTCVFEMIRNNKPSFQVHVLENR